MMITENDNKPYVSIVYLTKNGGDKLQKSIDAVVNQEASFDYEVIAVDSGSTDSTLEVLSQKYVKVYKIEPETFNFGLTRDYGFSLTAGDIIVTLSQDVIPTDSKWLQSIVAPFSDPSVAVVQGIDIVPDDEPLFYWYSVGLFFYTSETKKWLKRYNGIGLSFTSCAIRKSIWIECPIGRAEMNEDKIFQKKIVSRGYKIIPQPLAKGFHAHVHDLCGLAKRCENEGIGWRLCDERYSFIDLLADIFNINVIKALINGVMNRQIKTLAEVLFPIVRPVYIYKGNHYGSKYKH